MAKKLSPQTLIRWFTESIVWDTVKDHIWPWIWAHFKGLAASLMGIIVSIVGQVREVEPFWIIVGVLLAVQATISIINGLQQRRGSSRSNALDEKGIVQNVELQELARGDFQNFNERITAYTKEPELYLKVPRPYIDFVLDVINSTVFLVDLGKEIDGDIHVGNVTLTQKREIRPASVTLSHAERKDIKIRQYLTPDDINDCKSYKNSDGSGMVPFDFLPLNIWLTNKNGIGYIGAGTVRQRLRIPTPIYISIETLVRSEA